MDLIYFLNIKAEILCVDEAEFRLTLRNRTSSIPDIISKNHSFLKQCKLS